MPHVKLFRSFGSRSIPAGRQLSTKPQAWYAMFWRAMAVTLCLYLVLPIWEPVSPQTIAQRMRPGDVLRIEVWRREELSGQFTVNLAGTLTHPLYRELHVTGIPLSEIEERLRAFLLRHEVNPLFSVQPLFKIAVGGAVRQPSIYLLPPETSVAQAIVMAGGPVERDRLEKVRVLRDGEELVLDLAAPTAFDLQFQVQSGDEIIVPRKRSLFRDYIAPIASVATGVITLINFVIRITD